MSPGDYDVYVAVKEKAAAGRRPPRPKIGVLKHEITVPSLDGELTTSSVIMAARSTCCRPRCPNDRQAENPYTFGAMKITPSLDNKFTKKDELNVIFWIYGAGVDARRRSRTSRWSTTSTRRRPTARSSSTRPTRRSMNAETLPPQFDLAAGHQLPGSLAVPLASFPEGDYRLEVKINDKTSGKTVTREATFSVAAQ